MELFWHPLKFKRRASKSQNQSSKTNNQIEKTPKTCPEKFLGDLIGVSLSGFPFGEVISSCAKGRVLRFLGRDVWHKRDAICENSVTVASCTNSSPTWCTCFFVRACSSQKMCVVARVKRWCCPLPFDTGIYCINIYTFSFAEVQACFPRGRQKSS